MYSLLINFSLSELILNNDEYSDEDMNELKLYSQMRYQLVVLIMF